MCVCVCVVNDLQHEILLPARLVAADRDGGAFDILHLQRHVGVEFVWTETGDLISCEILVLPKPRPPPDQV